MSSHKNKNQNSKPHSESNSRAIPDQKKDNRRKYKSHEQKKKDANSKPEYYGTVKRWNDNGYGFILWNGEDEEEDDPQDVFFHMSEVTNKVSNKGSWLSDSPGRKCTFSLGLNPKSRKMQAMNVCIW